MFNSLFWKLFIFFLIFSIGPSYYAGQATLKDATEVNNTAVESIKFLGQRAITVSEKALEDLGKQLIENIAYASAKECDLYLKLHSKLMKESSPDDRSLLTKDKGLREVALQPVGTKGYTAFFENTGRTWIHQNPKIEKIGMQMKTLEAKFPSFWNIFYQSTLGKNYGDYYDWPDPDGVTRKKYMFCANVGNTPFRIAATTYLEDFNQPMKEIREQILTQMSTISKVTKKAFQVKGTEGNILVIIGIAFVLSVILSIFLAGSVSKPLKNLAEVSNKLSMGDLNVIVSEDMKNKAGELGDMAKSLEKITSSVKHMQGALERR